MSNPTKPLRVVIQQPSLAKYRVPVYRALAQTPGLDLKVVYGKDPGVPNVEPDGFNASFEPHRHLGIGRRRPFVWQPAQIKYAHRDHADVLVMVWNSRWLSLAPALRKAHKNGVRTVLWGHGYSKTESPWRAGLRRRLARMADAVLFYSSTVADRYIADGFDPARIFTAPNALDQAPITAARDAWLSDPDRLADFRKQNDVPETHQPILYVSRFDPANRVDLLIQAAALLAPTHPHMCLHLVGKGQPEQARLEKIAADLGVSDRVRFLGAIYDEDQLAPWFLTAKAFCYPANIGLSIHHAMGYGLPVVTDNNADTQNPEFEALAHGVNGLVYPPGDVDALASALKSTLDDEPRRQALASQARQTTDERYNLQAMTAGYLEALGHHDANAGDS